MLSREEEVNVDVNKDDQDRINTFASKNTEMRELELELNFKKERIEELEDAISALYDSEDEKASIMIGESLMILPRMDVIEKIEQMSESEADECQQIEEKIATLKQHLSELKVILYAKFKNSINLED